MLKPWKLCLNISRIFQVSLVWNQYYTQQDASNYVHSHSGLMSDDTVAYDDEYAEVFYLDEMWAISAYYCS